MPYFKAPDNGVHFLEDIEFISLLPQGSTEITQSEAEVLTYVEPTVVPDVIPVVSAFQAQAALMQAGALDAIEAYMVDPATDEFVKLAWRKVQEFRRDSPVVASIAPVLGISEAQLDDLFAFASTITV